MFVLLVHAFGPSRCFSPVILMRQLKGLFVRVGAKNYLMILLFLPKFENEKENDKFWKTINTVDIILHFDESLQICRM